MNVLCGTGLFPFYSWYWYWYWYWYWLMPLFRVRQKLTLEMAETRMRRMRCAWGFEFCRPFPVPGKLWFFYVHTRSIHGAACLTSSLPIQLSREYCIKSIGDCNQWLSNLEGSLHVYPSSTQ